jgi:hypothetical protein
MSNNQGNRNNAARGSVNLNPTINIWQDILKESMSEKDLEESNVFFFGDKFSGKRTLIKYINKELLQKNEFDDQGKRTWGQDDNNFSKYSLLDYTFLSVKKYTEYDSGIYFVLLYNFLKKNKFILSYRVNWKNKYMDG